MRIEECSMERATHYRPRISRETRLLVTTAVLAMLALWMLARLRFPAPPAQPRAISQLLTSLGAGADFDALSSQVARAQGLVGDALGVLVFDLDHPTAGRRTLTRPVLRIGGDIAVVQVPDGGRLRADSAAVLLAQDRASGLGILRLGLDTATSGVSPKLSALPEPPQYLIATAVYPDGVALRPIFLAATAEVDVATWSARGWVVPEETGLTTGTFLFTREGEFAGLTVSHDGATAIVSSETVLDEANRLVASPATPPATCGVEVETLTPELGRALGAMTGVAVAWVDPAGAADGAIAAGDVIESADGRPISSRDHWRRFESGAAPGVEVTIGIRRAGKPVTVTLTPRTVSGAQAATSATAAKGARDLGAVLRPRAADGVEVVSVTPNSLAALSGLLPGDIVTSVGGLPAPSPAAVLRAVQELTGEQSLWLAVRRGDGRHLLVVE